MKDFLKTKEFKRAIWTIANTLMALVVSFIVFLATEESVGWAITVMPIAQAISQYATKFINAKYL